MPLLNYSFNDDFFYKQTLVKYQNFKYNQAIYILDSIAKYLNIDKYKYPSKKANPCFKSRSKIFEDRDLKLLTEIFKSDTALSEITAILKKHNLKYRNDDTLKKEFHDINPNNAKEDLCLALLFDSIYELLIKKNDEHLLGTSLKESSTNLMKETVKHMDNFFLKAFPSINDDLDFIQDFPSPETDSLIYYHSYAANIIDEHIDLISCSKDNEEKIQNKVINDPEFKKEMSLFQMNWNKDIDLVSNNYIEYFKHTLAPSEDILKIYKRNHANASATAKKNNLKTNNEILPLYDQMVFLYHGMCFISYLKNYKNKTIDPIKYPRLYNWNKSIKKGYLADNAYINGVKNIPKYFNPTSDILENKIFNPSVLTANSKLASKEKIILTKFLAECYLIHLNRLKKLLKKYSSALKTNNKTEINKTSTSLVKEIFYIEHVIRHSSVLKESLPKNLPKYSLYHLSLYMHFNIRISNLPPESNNKKILNEEYDKYSITIDNFIKSSKDISKEEDLLEKIEDLFREYIDDNYPKKTSINFKNFCFSNLIEGILNTIILDDENIIQEYIKE